MEKEKEVLSFFNKTKKNIISLYGNKGLDNYQMDEIGKKYLKNKFKGVFAVNNIPFKPGLYIVNTDKANKPGLHWIAVKQTKTKIYIYDSFSRKSSNILKILYDKAIKKGLKIIDVNFERDQNDKSELCGPISLSWLITMNTFGIKYKYVI